MITRTTETAFRILITLASFPDDRVVPLGELHTHLGGSQTYLAKVTTSLTRARIVRSTRGSQGGLMLARSPKDITLLDVLSATQGMPAQVATASSDPGIGNTRMFHAVMEDVHQSVLASFRSHSIADLLQEPCENS